jgi:CRISPR type III-B/RAMP module RAMP protein Cmr1
LAKRELKVTLETVTPMFMAGIDPNTPELRPPSILGPLRYWLRAAVGGSGG